MRRVTILLAVVFLLSCEEHPLIPSEIDLKETELSLSEASGVGAVTVSLDPPASRDLSLFYQVDAYLATDGLDFKILSPNPILIKSGSAEASIRFEIINDSEIGENICQFNTEQFRISLLKTDEGYSDVVRPDHAEIYIEDDDLDFPELTASLTWDVGNGTPGDVDLDLVQLNSYHNLYGYNWSPTVLSHNEGTTFESGQLLLHHGTNHPGSGKTSTWRLTAPYLRGSAERVDVTLIIKSIKGGNVINGQSEITYKWSYLQSDKLKSEINQLPQVSIEGCSLNGVYYVCNGKRVEFHENCALMEFVP